MGNFYVYKLFVVEHGKKVDYCIGFICIFKENVLKANYVCGLPKNAKMDYI